jgi:hypothetical protein
VYASSILNPLSVSNLEFKPAVGQGGDQFVGRISFQVNGYINFRNLPIYRNSLGIHIDFPPVLTTTFPGHACRQIEARVAEQIEELSR